MVQFSALLISVQIVVNADRAMLQQEAGKGCSNHKVMSLIQTSLWSNLTQWHFCNSRKIGYTMIFYVTDFRPKMN